MAQTPALHAPTPATGNWDEPAGLTSWTGALSQTPAELPDTPWGGPIDVDSTKNQLNDGTCS